jgi:hypothetical protein
LITFWIAIVDSHISEQELQTLMETGTKIMQYREKEVAQKIAAALYSAYVPRVK